jgi:hypothetical protein
MSDPAGTTRIPLVWSPWLRPLGFLIGGFASRSWVEVRPDKVTASFGSLARAEVPRSSIRSVEPLRWPWWWGYGVRWYGREAAGFVGRGKGVVQITVEPPVEVRAVLPRRVRRLALSPKDPGQLLALLTEPGFPGE